MFGGEKKSLTITIISVSLNKFEAEMSKIWGLKKRLEDRKNNKNKLDQCKI